ncbi:MAG: protein kinase [Myxococcota bacterium]
MNLDESAAALKTAGRHAEAARLLSDAGRHREAAECFAAVWKWDDAIAEAQRAEDDVLAYRYALETGAHDRQTLIEQLGASADDASQAASLAEAKGHSAEAARLHELAGDHGRAADFYESLGEYGRAARLAERDGKDRRAGRLYERALRENPSDAQSALRLGHILIKFGRFEQAAAALQRVGESTEQRLALRLLVGCLAALSMERAAGEALERLSAIDPNVPRDLRAFLQETFGDARGLVGLARGGDAGKQLAGRYRIVRPLGAGGSGRVMLGRDAFYDRLVAIKVLNVGGGDRGRDRYARFEREAEIAASLDHPNIVRVFDFHADGPFLVMEYMEGGTLDARLDDLEPASVRAIALSILDGLEAVHRRGVVHRDLKPANVFFSAAGDVKLGDFGVAHLQDLESTLTGAMMGTLAYMAPEQITGSEKPTARTDLYAFGVMLYRMLSHALPFDEEDLIEGHLRGRVVPPSERHRSLANVDALIGALLSKGPEERPPDAEAVRQAILACTWPTEHLRANAAPSAAPAPTKARAVRYVILETRPDGSKLVEDAWLERTVRIEPAPEDQRAYLRRAAASDHPYLQAVYEIRDDEASALLEEPAGEPLSDLVLDDTRYGEVCDQLREGLRALHEGGLAHGDVGPAAVRVGSGRAVLLLPSRVFEDATKAKDEQALEQLLAKRT